MLKFKNNVGYYIKLICHNKNKAKIVKEKYKVLLSLTFEKSYNVYIFMNTFIRGEGDEYVY